MKPPDPLAKSAVIAVCALADAAGPDRWSSAAVEDAATARWRCPPGLSGLSPVTSGLLEVISADTPRSRTRPVPAPRGRRHGLLDQAGQEKR